MSSDKRSSGPPESGQGGRGRYGTNVYDSRNNKYSSRGGQAGDGAPDPLGDRDGGRIGGRRGQLPIDGGDGTSVGGLPLTQGGRGRQGGGRRGSVDNGRGASVEGGKGTGRRRGSVDSGEQEKDKSDKNDDAASGEGSSQDVEQVVGRQRGRILFLSSKGDWPALDHALKVLERFVPEQGVGGSAPAPYQPLKDLADEVSSDQLHAPKDFTSRAPINYIPVLLAIFVLYQ